MIKLSSFYFLQAHWSNMPKIPYKPMWENRETAIWQAKFEIWIYNVFDRQFQLDYYLVSKCDKEYT